MTDQPPETPAELLYRPLDLMGLIQLWEKYKNECYSKYFDPSFDGFMVWLNQNPSKAKL